MKINKRAIEEFKVMYQKKFGIELADEKAYEKAYKLLSIVRLIFNNSLRK